MIFTSPMPFGAAVQRLESKTPIAADLSSAEWSQMQLGILDRSFFSSRVNDIRTVAEMQSRISDALTLVRRDGGAFMDRSRFIADMRSYLGAASGDSGEITDLTSAGRLGLIYDFNVEDAMEYGRWMARQDPDILDAFPCNELVRIEHREVPRGYRRGAKGRLVEVPDESWPSRWAAAGGQFVGGRMIAAKDDPIWTKISRFGRPWPPFDFNSGMGLADISRKEAEQLGVIDPDAPAPKPQHLDFNHNLQSSIPDATPEVLSQLEKVFGDQIQADRDGKVVWQGQRLARLYSAALADSSVKWSLNLGEATPEAIAAASDLGVDLEGASLVIEADEIRHAENRHGAGNESRSDQRPLTSLDFQLVPHVWRNPDSVELGDKDGTLVFSKSLLGEAAIVTYDRQGKSGKWGFLTMYVKTKGGTL
ncbi:MAG TPA: hypothetical protein VGG34_01460 [Opitutaceae bacterium]|jgi:hypothetical protein